MAHMPHRQFTIRRLMLVVFGCAVVCAILRLDVGQFLFAVLCIMAGPILGVVVERRLGGPGILGGLLGGVVQYGSFGIVKYLRADLFSGPITLVLWTDLGFLVLLTSGALVGAVVGALSWGVTRIDGRGAALLGGAQTIVQQPKVIQALIPAAFGLGTCILVACLALFTLRPKTERRMVPSHALGPLGPPGLSPLLAAVVQTGPVAERSTCRVHGTAQIRRMVPVEYGCLVPGVRAKDDYWTAKESSFPHCDDGRP
jgi:hypothetical protein